MEKDACPGPKPTNGFLNLPFAETFVSNPEQPNIPSLSEQTTSPAHNPTTTRTTRSRSKSPQLRTETTLPSTKPAKRHSQTSLEEEKSTVHMHRIYRICDEIKKLFKLPRCSHSLRSFDVHHTRN